jgi:hypothetical protein
MTLCIKKKQKKQKHRIHRSTLKTKQTQLSERVSLTNILTFRLMTEQIYKLISPD